VIANNNARNSRTNLDDNSCTFMTTDDREETFNTHEGPKFFWWNHVASDQVLITVAQSSGTPMNDHFSGFWRMDFDLFDLPLLIQTPQHSGF